LILNVGQTPSSGDLKVPDSSQVFSDLIVFSKPFHTTGVKILLRKEYAQTLSKSSPEKFGEHLKKLKIGVLKGTTTSRQFESRGNLYQDLIVEPLKDSNEPNNPNKGTNALERALSALDNDGSLGNGTKIDALASDAIILESFLINGVKESGGKRGELAYVEARFPRGSQGFAVFPSKEFPSPDGGSYLPGFDQENYAIAIAKGQPNETWLSQVINNSLRDLNDPESDLGKAKDNLKPYEIGFKSPGEIDVAEPDRNLSPDRWWLPIIVAIVAALASIVGTILNPELVRTVSGWVTNNTKQSQTQPTTRTVTVIGRVLNSRTGAWIGGAKVSLEAGRTPPIEYTDAEGIFEFVFQSSDSRIKIRVEADGYEMFDRRIDISSGGGMQDIRLKPIS
jgi:ABC-type amino acid transport substrate-binding protein